VRPEDYNDIQALENSLQSVNTLLLISGIDEPEKHIGEHRNMIQGAKNAGVKKMSIPVYR
jgi:NAD(P)H dehydrogenase (quinone)